MSIFYEIIAPNGQKSYLLGTIHLSDKQLVTMPLEVKTAFVNARICVFEINTNITYEEHQKGEHIKKIWLQSAKEQGMTKEEEIRFQESTPMILAHRFLVKKEGTTSAEKHGNNFLDGMLLAQAKENNKELFYLETFEKQLTGLFGYNFPYRDHLQFYNFAKDHVENGTTQLPGIKALKELYLSQNIQEIARNTSPSFAENQPDIVTQYFKNIFENRDITLADALEIPLVKGNAFVALGAAHLPGVTKHLKLKGYAVNPIELSDRVYSIDSMILPEKEAVQTKASHILNINDLYQALKNTSIEYHDLIWTHKNVSKLITNTGNLADVLVKIFPLYSNAKESRSLLNKLFYQFDLFFDSENFFEILRILAKTNLLNEKNCLALLENAKYIKPISIILNCLSDLLNDKNFALIMREAKYSKNIARALLALQKSGILTDVYLNMLLERIQHINSVSKMLIMLHSLGILTQSNYKTVLEMIPFDDNSVLQKLTCDNSIEMEKQIQWIGALLLDKKWDELSLIKHLFDENNETGPVLRTHKNKTIFLWEVLYLMQKMNILNKKNLDSLLYFERNNYYGNVFTLFDFLTLLDKAHFSEVSVLFNDNVFNSLIDDCNTGRSYYTKILTILSGAEILNESNFNALMLARSLPLISLKKLQKSNLVTNANFQLLLSKSLNGKHASKEEIVEYLIKQKNDNSVLNPNMMFNPVGKDQNKGGKNENEPGSFYTT